MTTVTKRNWILAAIVAAAAALGFFVGQRTADPKPEAIAEPVLAMASPQPQGETATPASIASSAAVSSRGDEEIEICGLGFVPADEAAQVLREGLTPSPEVVTQVSGSLRASTSAPARALGLWLQAMAASERAAAAANAELAKCGDDGSCLAAIRDAVFPKLTEARQPGIDALAREAAGTEDAAVYAMAIQACHTFEPRFAAEGNCQLISLERWAQLDPNNAVPWTFLAGAAATRNDANAAGEALYRASISNSSRVYGDSILAIAAPALETGLTDTQRRQLVEQLLGIQASWTLPPLVTALKMCSDDALNDGNRRQVCDAFATTLIDKGRTLIERGIGIRLGERLRWPAERLDALRLEREALAHAVIEGDPLAGRESSCDARTRAIDAALRAPALDEIGRARADIAASGRSLDDWARRGRERREALLAARAASASAH